jgi:hypothetical protein
MTGSTMGGGKNKRLVTGQTVNTDIEKASHAHPEKGENNDKDGFHYALYFVCFCR